MQGAIQVLCFTILNDNDDNDDNDDDDCHHSNVIKQQTNRCVGENVLSSVLPVFHNLQ